MTILQRMNLFPLPNFSGAGAGGAGASTVAAGAGADTVAAGAGASTVAAGAGSDTLKAGAGADTMAGGGAWPENWRDEMAGGDAKFRERLGRYATPKDFARAGIEAQNKIQSGKAGEDIPMPDPAKDPDGAKAWREARGIPPDPKAYKIPDPVDKRLSDADKVLFGTLAEKAHGKNIPASSVEVVAEWYADQLEAQRGAQVEQDNRHAEEIEETLRKDWGPDYKANDTVARRYAEEVLGEGVSLFDARLPDGRKVGNVPEIIKGLAELGLAKYGDVSFAGGEAARVSEGRMAELKKMMDSDWDAWMANQPARDEYAKLLEAAQKRAPKQ